jgi:hypothetical protein
MTSRRSGIRTGISLAKTAKTPRPPRKIRKIKKAELRKFEDQSIGLIAATMAGSTSSWKSGPLSRTYRYSIERNCIVF